jgi:hypothetical protein
MFASATCANTTSYRIISRAAGAYSVRHPSTCERAMNPRAWLIFRAIRAC